MRAAFMGTPDFAVPILEALAAHCQQGGDTLALVICQPDRPAGRGLQLQAPPVKVAAERLGVPVAQPHKVRDGTLAAQLRQLQLDVIVVAAYGRILPRDVLDAPRLGCINVHASLLPELRGAAPIHWAVARGHQETGVTLMRMEEGLDTGAIYATRSIAIAPDETSGELTQRLSQLGGVLLREELPRFLAGELVAVAQDDARATFAPVLEKDNGRIDWRKNAQELHDHVRAMQPWPTAFTRIGEKNLKVHRTRIVRDVIATTVERQPGTILLAERSGVVVACGSDGSETLAIVEAQLEGKKRMPAYELALGRVLGIGARLGATPQEGAVEGR